MDWSVDLSGHCKEKEPGKHRRRRDQKGKRITRCMGGSMCATPACPGRVEASDEQRESRVDCLQPLDSNCPLQFAGVQESQQHLSRCFDHRHRCTQLVRSNGHELIANPNRRFGFGATSSLLIKQLLFRAFLILTQGVLLESTCDSLPETRQAVLQKVVVRPKVKGTHSGFFTRDAGDEDERDSRATFPEEPKTF
jgi:hypothetical protein